MIIPLLMLTLQSAHPHSAAVLVTDVSVAAPGKPFLAAMYMKMDPTWHTYWVNPGDSGIPPTVKWTLPPGWKAGPILWPTPQRLVVNGLVNYGYESEALFLTQITPPASARRGTTVALRGEAEWLICQEGCLPAKQSVSTEIRIGSVQEANGVWAGKIAQAEQTLPKKLSAFSFSAVRHGKAIQLTVMGPVPAGWNSFYFFPETEVVEPAAKQQVQRSQSSLMLTLKVSDFAPTSISRLRGLLRAPKGQDWGDNTDAIIVDTPVVTNGG